jgi:hypothetical protein
LFGLCLLRFGRGGRTLWPLAVPRGWRLGGHGT